MEPSLSESQLREFQETGILVIEGVFDDNEIKFYREGLRHSLQSFGVIHDDLEQTAFNLRKLSSTSGAGGVLDLFYADWKFSLSQNPKLFSVLSQLWAATYASDRSQAQATDESGAPLFWQPHGEFNPAEGFFYLDRVGYRVPEEISWLHGTGKNKSKPLQRSLTPHLDCCAKDLYGNLATMEEHLRRWRPIQAFVALTPNIEANTGGFEAVPGFHKEFRRHFAKKEDEVEETEGEERQKALLEDQDSARICIGEFSPLVPKIDQSVLERFQHIPYGAGSVVCWDWRTPHANAQKNTGKQPREVVYTGFLPNVPTNQRFALAQLENYRKGQLPNHVWHHHKYSDGPQEGLNFNFSPLGQKLMAMQPWGDS